MKIYLDSKKYFFLAAAIGSAVTYSALKLLSNNSLQIQQMSILEGRVKNLELLLIQKEEELFKARSFYYGNTSQDFQSNKNNLEKFQHPNNNTNLSQSTQSPALNQEAIGSQQLIKDLVTQSDRDPRSFSEKMNELLVSNASQDAIAIASKSIFDMAENPEHLPDYVLTSIYQDQGDSNIKRIAAQVMSLRGDNSLIEKHITEAHHKLHSDDPTTRQQALVDLAKTHYVGAANAIIPLLQDDNIGVKLDALLALRATGNQNHIYPIEALVNDSDPSVSWLARDVINNLKNLSEHARTSLSHADIATELPPLVNP